jgi:carbonic anhydrase/acetyltransferase-like protein (isoleucine patch superfamily)
MIRRNPRGDTPVVHESAFVDHTAIICGQVIVGENVFIGPYAVIRADEVNAHGDMEPIIIGANSNIQDGVVIHSRSGGLVSIGESTTIAHRSIVHGPCTVGSFVFVGFNSVLFNCVVHDHAVVRHSCVIDGRVIPERFYVPSSTKVNHETDLATLPRVSPAAEGFSEDVVRTNLQLARDYRRIQNEF